MPNRLSSPADDWQTKESNNGRQTAWNSSKARLVAKYYSILSDVYGMKHDDKKRAWEPNVQHASRASGRTSEKEGIACASQNAVYHTLCMFHPASVNLPAD